MDLPRLAPDSSRVRRLPLGGRALSLFVHDFGATVFPLQGCTTTIALPADVAEDGRRAYRSLTVPVSVKDLDTLWIDLETK